MFREFFLGEPRKRRVFAWLGLLVFLGHGVFKAWLKARLNTWYKDFYDTLQDSSVALVANLTEAERVHLEEKRTEVFDLLVEFAIIVSPSLLVHPIAKYIGSLWKFSWRVALVESYLSHSDVNEPPVDSAAQRIHEDTLRFEAGIYTAIAIVLDSALTLIVFIPILIDCGAQAQPTWVPSWLGSAWLTLIAVQSAVYGLSISAFVGRRLVDLEVENQTVEAKLRTKLVMLEQMPTTFVEDAILLPDTETVSQAQIVPEIDGQVLAAPPEWNPLNAFKQVLRELWGNYRRLFIEFIKFNSWVAVYDQALVILPYMLVAPLIFEDDFERRITLGTLTQATNAFDKVFSSLAVVAESWAAINDFRSTIRRLQVFEEKTYSRRAFNGKRTEYSELNERTSSTAASVPPPVRRVGPVAESHVELAKVY